MHIYQQISFQGILILNTWKISKEEADGFGIEKNTSIKESPILF